MGRVEGKICVVTGAASGLGEADARTLAAEGATVVLTDINEQDGERIAGEIGGDALFIRHDVPDADHFDELERLAETDSVFFEKSLALIESNC